MSKFDIALSVRGLSKSYTIAHEQETHVTLAETMLARLKNPLRRPKTETFWALKDIEFDIKKGDVVGIIGRNGAGKSTLLKILSRITEPTTGRIDLYGRVGSLLEVGTGFHPELTGRENIFLNGAILGMTKAEIKKQFDAIVDFAGVEQFLDTPVKRYSSGMYVRLAFAVAAHLESEILIVDEVLAVGDAEFQKKCLGKMKDVASGGRTVLFVSHEMQSVSALCRSAVYLRRGKNYFNGSVPEAIQLYVASFGDTGGVKTDAERRLGTGEYRITMVKPCRSLFSIGEDIEISFSIDCKRMPAPGAYLNVVAYDSGGTHVFTCDLRTSGVTLPQSGTFQTVLRLSNPWLKPGDYRILARVCNQGAIDVIEDACRFSISGLQPYRDQVVDPLATAGVVLADYEFASPITSACGRSYESQQGAESQG